MASALTGSCGTANDRVTIEFTPLYGNESIGCGSSVPIHLTDLRLYLSDIRLIDMHGKSVTVGLEADGLWQQRDLVLLDFEDGQGGCSNGSAVMNVGLIGSVPAGTYRGLAFTVGVPFDRNHADPLTAAPPLGDAAMHWHWRGGYKFLRAGVATAEGSYWVHLGSTGCEGTIGSISSCRAPNRVSVLLENFRPGSNTVIIDLSKLIPRAQMANGIAASCSSGPAEPGCDNAFAALGLPHRGHVADGIQTLFREGRQP